MAAMKIKLDSNFIRAKDAGHDAVAQAIRKAIDAGGNVTKKKIDSQAGSRGYNLDSGAVSTNVTPFDGAIMVGAPADFWWRFFEYGSKNIPAMPSIRPGSRKARKVLKQELDENFEKFISRRAAVKLR